MAEHLDRSLLERYFPPEARHRRIEGRAVLRCTLDAASRVTECPLVEQAPAGFGFGAAAVSVARALRFTPKLIDGRPVGGAKITLPVNFFLAGSSTAFTPQTPAGYGSPSDRAPTIGPVEAIQSAAAAAPRAVVGVFVMRVSGAGRQDGNIYLNSEADYRDQRNLTVAFHPAAAESFIAQYGTAPDTFLVGKRIAVSGGARRVRINFSIDGRPTEKYYYQTHVNVWNSRQIRILGAE